MGRSGHGVITRTKRGGMGGAAKGRWGLEVRPMQLKAHSHPWGCRTTPEGQFTPHVSTMQWLSEGAQAGPEPLLAASTAIVWFMKVSLLMLCP